MTPEETKAAVMSALHDQQQKNQRTHTLAIMAVIIWTSGPRITQTAAIDEAHELLAEVEKRSFAL